MTPEQLKELCKLYNGSDIDALQYIKENNQGLTKEQKKELEILLLENDLLFYYNCTDVDEGCYHDRKWKLLESLGVSNDCGDAYIKE